MKLYLDVGNSRMKWRVSDSRSTQVVLSYSTLEIAWRQMANDHGTINVEACCVRNDGERLLIKDLVKKTFNTDILWRDAQLEQCGVINGYDTPKELGADRWAALIGARTRNIDSDCVVVDAGTAITVDYLAASGQHFGGVILPGISSMLKTLNMADQLSLQYEAVSDHLHALAKTTQKGLVAGVVFSAQGGVKSVIEEQAASVNLHMNDLLIFITGGDSDLLNVQAKKIVMAPDLVLEGLQAMGTA